MNSFPLLRRCATCDRKGYCEITSLSSILHFHLACKMKKILLTFDIYICTVLWNQLLHFCLSAFHNYQEIRKIIKFQMTGFWLEYYWIRGIHSHSFHLQWKRKRMCTQNFHKYCVYIHLFILKKLLLGVILYLY